MKTKTTATLFLFVPVCFAMGCRRHPRVKVVGLSAAPLEEADALAVDGKAEEGAWQQAAVMPFEKTGEARFVWNPEKLYGFVRKYEHQKFGFDFDEQICIMVRVGGRVAKLFFEEQRRPDAGSPGLAGLS